MGLSPMRDFVTTVIWKTLVQRVINIFQMLIHFINSFLFLPVHIISNTTDLVGKVFKYWEAVKLAVMV